MLGSTTLGQNCPGEKAVQILEGARQVFLRDGFDAASMNDIARAAGVSKGTLYVYFASKAELFAALVTEERRRLVDPILCFDLDDRDVRSVLTQVGRAIVRATMAPQNIAQLRMVMSVAAKMPQIGRAYYETGLNSAIERLAAYLSRQAEDQILSIDDCELAAAQFLQACHGGNLLRVLFCISDTPSENQIELAVRRAVDMFVAYYALREDR